MWKKMSLA